VGHVVLSQNHRLPLPTRINKGTTTASTRTSSSTSTSTLRRIMLILAFNDEGLRLLGVSVHMAMRT
jgi:hypothetical protein